jgi:hypothetical protein
VVKGAQEVEVFGLEDVQRLFAKGNVINAFFTRYRPLIVTFKMRTFTADPHCPPLLLV